VIHRRRRRIIAGFAIGFVLTAILALPVFGELDSANDFDDPSAEAVHARDAIQDATGVTASPDIIVLVRRLDRVPSVERGLRDPSVARIAAGPRSTDGRATYLLAWFKHPGGGNVNAIQRRLGQEPYVSLGGGAFAVEQVGNQVSSDIARAELIAFPILFLLSLIVFRSAVSALLPLAVGGTSILAGFLVVRIVNQFNGMSPYALNLVNGVGLGLAIDYSLFMVSRFREELANGATTEQAVSRMLRSAGHTVAFSGVTVAAALAALLIFRQRFLYSMGAGERGRAEALEGRHPARGAGRALRLLVSPLAPRDAPSGAGGGGRGDAADRAGAPVHGHPLHGRRRVGVAALAVRARGR
jgi:RND superfamily putative drug exporter